MGHAPVVLIEQVPGSEIADALVVAAGEVSLGETAIDQDAGNADSD